MLSWNFLHLIRTNEISPLNLIVTIMTVNLSAVVELMVVDDMLTVPEGGMAFVCINVTNSEQMRETDIILSFSVTEGNTFTIVCPLYLLLLLTFLIINYQEKVKIIEPSIGQACLL